jgi:hypothetical protein
MANFNSQSSGFGSKSSSTQVFTQHVWRINPATGRPEHLYDVSTQNPYEAGFRIRRSNGSLGVTNYETLSEMINNNSKEPLVQYAINQLRFDAEYSGGKFGQDYYKGFAKMLINRAVKIYGADRGMQEVERLFAQKVENAPSKSPYHIFEAIAAQGGFNWDKVQHFTKSATMQYRDKSRPFPLTNTAQYGKEIRDVLTGGTFDWEDMRANNEGQAFGQEIYDQAHPSVFANTPLSRFTPRSIPTLK